MTQDKDIQIYESIQMLSQILQENFNKNVFIIIDEYDAPLNSSIGKEYFSFISEHLGAMYRLGMKNNKFVEKSIMTGILPLAKANLFSGLNNFIEYGVLNKLFAEHFGFTDA